MDGQHFDRIARALGSGQSRRSVFRAIAASAVGAFVGVKAIDQAEATIVCGVQGDTCSVDGVAAPMCCAGHSCLLGTGGLACIEDPPDCADLGESCAETSCCDSDHFCGPTSICEDASSICASHRQLCDEEVECCEGLVCSSGGICAIENPVCRTDFDPCDYYEGDVLVGCCAGYQCVQNGESSACVFVCAAEGSSCDQISLTGESGDGTCCDGLVCNGEGICVTPEPACSVAGEGCADNACCDGLTCLDDMTCGYPPEKPEKPKPPAKPVEPVVKLPDTGAGQGESGSEWLIPGALGVAAAAIAAQKLLNDKANATDETA